jgi:transposase
LLSSVFGYMSAVANIKIKPEHEVILVQIVESDPTITLLEIRREFTRRTGMLITKGPVTKALERQGVVLVPSHKAVVIEKAPVKPPRYGYTGAHRRHAPEQDYPSSLTDAEWALVQDIFENKGRGLPPRISRRTVVDACCYVVRSGCAWRMLPRHFPSWQNVYRTFRRWSEQGKFERMHDRLREQWREREARSVEPTAAVLDSQSTRGSAQGGDTGFDGGKKVKGRKRHLLVDTLGLLLAVSVTAANIHDHVGAHPIVAEGFAKYPNIQTLYVDNGYAGQCAQTISQRHETQVKVIRHPANKNVGRWVRSQQLDLFTVQANANGFVPQAKRWVVERSHAWNDRARRLAVHYDRLPRVAEAWVWLAQGRILLRRLTA